MGTKVATSVSDEDIRRSYYETAGYSMWITEMQLDPLQLIVADDSTGKSFRVPVTLDTGEFTFGEPVEVQVQYVDAGKVKTSAITYASRDESTKGLQRVNQPPPPASEPISAAEAARKIHNAPVAGSTGDSGQEGPIVDPKAMRLALGLPETATDAELLTAMASQAVSLTSGTPQTQPTPTPTPTPAPAPTPLPGEEELTPTVGNLSAAGAVLLDPSTLAALTESAKRGERAYRQLRENEADQVIQAAVKAGKFAPSRAQAWKDLWAADPDGTKDTISKLKPNTVPVDLLGAPGVGEESENDLVYRSLYPEGV